MSANGRKVLAGFLVWTAVATTEVYADQIWVASGVCIVPNSRAGCSEFTSGPAVFRVLNELGQLYIPSPGSNDIFDVTLDFTYDGGSLTWHWDSIPPALLPGMFVETGPFDIALLNKLISLQLSATLPRTVFDPAFAGNPYLKFTADSQRVSGTLTQFPEGGPLEVFAQGRFEMTPTPEPATLTFVGLGLAGLVARSRIRRTHST